MSTDIPIINSPEPIAVIDNDGTAKTKPEANSSTIYEGMKGMPAFIYTRRNRARNRARIDKVNRNRRSLRILRNARSRQIAQTGHSDLPDVRLDPTCPSDFGTPKPVYRGAKRAGREARYWDRIIKAMDEQRIRYHLATEAIEAIPEDKYPMTFEGHDAFCDEVDQVWALQRYGMEPPKPCVNAGPQNSYVAQTGRYAPPSPSTAPVGKVD